METLTYWVQRLEPIIRAEYDDEIIVVFANRSGIEDDVVYAGTSTVLGIRDGEVSVYGLLGRGAKELLVVNTEMPPIAKLVNRPDPPPGSEEQLRGDEAMSESASTAAAPSIPETATSPRTQNPRSPRATLPPTPEDVTHPEIEEDTPRPVAASRHGNPAIKSPTSTHPLKSPKSPSTSGLNSSTRRNSPPPPSRDGMPQTPEVCHRRPSRSSARGYFPETPVADYGEIPTKIDFTRTPVRNLPPGPPDGGRMGGRSGGPAREPAPPSGHPNSSTTAPSSSGRRPRRPSRSGPSPLAEPEGGEAAGYGTARRRPESPTTPPAFSHANEVGSEPPQAATALSGPDGRGRPLDRSSATAWRRHSRSASADGPVISGDRGSGRTLSKEGGYRVSRPASCDRSGLGTAFTGLATVDIRSPLRI